MKITVIGCGYVGLVTAACLAGFGHTVTGVEKDPAKVSALKEGSIPFYEEDLAPLVAAGLENKKLFFQEKIDESIAGAEVVFIAVGTPSLRNGAADLRQVFKAAAEIAPYLKKYTVVVNKSTVPVGTAKRVQEIIKANLTAKVSFAVVSNPEFLREGKAVNDFFRPDRVVVGTNSPRAEEVMKKVYARLLDEGTPFIWTTPETAELIKYAANAFLATKISFINEIANLCEAAGADIDTVALGMGLDKRIGGEFLRAGPGYGGSCFPKDTRALAHMARSYGQRVAIVETVIKVNEEQKARMVQKIRKAAGGLKGKTIALLGMAFKPGVDDLRESPAVAIAERLLAAGAKIQVHDPMALVRVKEVFGTRINCCQDPYAAATGAGVLIIATDWPEYRELDLAAIKKLMHMGKTPPALLDLRNIFAPQEVCRHGFRYQGVGRGWKGDPEDGLGK